MVESLSDQETKSTFGREKNLQMFSVLLLLCRITNLYGFCILEIQEEDVLASSFALFVCCNVNALQLFLILHAFWDNYPLCTWMGLRPPGPRAHHVLQIPQKIFFHNFVFGCGGVESAAVRWAYYRKGSSKKKPLLEIKAALMFPNEQSFLQIMK